MENIFENAYFGKRYRTSEDDVALYLGEDIGDFKYRLAYPIISNITNKKSYIILQCDENGSSKCDIDIVSEWQEPINEEEVDRLAEEFCDEEYEHPTDVNKAQNGMELGYSNLFNCYKAGYRKGYERINTTIEENAIDVACDIFADIINEVLPINASDTPYIKKFRKTMEDYLNGKSNI